MALVNLLAVILDCNVTFVQQAQLTMTTTHLQCVVLVLLASTLEQALYPAQTVPPEQQIKTLMQQRHALCVQ